MLFFLRYSEAHLSIDPDDTQHPINMTDSKQEARDETNYRLGIASRDSEILQKAGRGSGNKRGKSYSPGEIKFPSPTEERTMYNAGNESANKRIHATEQIAKHYRNSRNS